MDKKLSSADLFSLLLNLTGLDEVSAVQLGLKSFKDECIGLQELHDGEKAIVHISRFEHAFFTTARIKGQPDKKTVLDRARIARVRWIKPIISGQVQQSACWEVIARSGRPAFPNRMYVLYEPAYVVWLEPRSAVADVPWKFSSAYPASPKYLREKTNGGVCIWNGKK